jgi:hypothetical protein
MVLFGATLLWDSAALARDGAASETSPYIRTAISAGLPKFEPREDAGKKPAGSSVLAAPKQTGAQPEVTRMPEFTVREAKLPAPERILTYKARTKVLMDEYMGDSDGFDRGVLNRHTLAELWSKIPVLGKLPFIGTAFNMSAPERALDDAGANNPETGGTIVVPDQ